MGMIRLYVQGPLAPGVTIGLDEARSHYLGRVMRRGVGDPVELFDGKSGGFSGRITAIAKRHASIEIVEQLRALPDRSTAPVLFQAVIKRPRFEWLVEKATELDVAAIVPVRTRRADAPLGRTERLATIAMEAAEQSGRLDLPAMLAEMPLAAIGPLRRPGRSLLVLDPAAKAQVTHLAAECQGDLDLLIGPEGGFAAEDDEVLAGMTQVVRGRIAPTVLRAETAAIAALAASAMLRCG